MAKPTDDELLEEVYIDETSQTGQRFLVLGGLTIPKYLSTEFDAYIANARTHKLTPRLRSDMTMTEMAWNDIGKGDFPAYQKVIDAYFSFAQPRLKTTLTKFEFHCSVVDTHIRGRRYSGKSGELSFNREIYFHCMTIARRHSYNLFHVYPDERSTEQDMNQMRKILNYAARRENPALPTRFRRLEFRQSHKSHAIQISDLLNGAVAYRLNGHYLQPGGTDKKMLCEHILKKGSYWQFISPTGFKEKAWSRFQVWFRRHKS
jgi:Protein of unknown function (DUF3800)